MSSGRVRTAKQDRTDWSRIDALTDDEIERMAADDGENPTTTEADWAEAFVGLPPRKTRIHASLDSDVVDWFRQQGRGYQTRMNAVLRRYMDAQARKHPLRPRSPGLSEDSTPYRSPGTRKIKRT